MTTVAFRVLGPLQATLDGVAVRLGGAKQRAVLAMLLLHANQVVSTDRLTEGVWGDAAPSRAGSTLQVYISTLRTLLEPDRRSASHDRLIVTHRPGYLIRASATTLDLLAFEQAAAGGERLLREGDHDGAAGRLCTALELWRGPALADLVDLPFHRAATAALEERRLQALEARIDADLAGGRHREVISELTKLVAEHPFREPLRGRLMLALARSERQAEALAVYSEVRATLATELGIDPGPQLQEVHRAVLAQDELVRARRADREVLLFHDGAGLQQTVRLDRAGSPVRVGRLVDNDVAVTWDREVSRHHAQLVWDDARWWLRDESRNGSFVNGVKIDAPHPLADGDAIIVGKTAITFRKPSERTGPVDVEYHGVTSLPQPASGLVQLTEVERAALRAVADALEAGAVGDSTVLASAMAARLGTTPTAVEDTLAAMYRRFGVETQPMPQRLHRLINRARMLGFLPTRR